MVDVLAVFLFLVGLVATGLGFMTFSSEWFLVATCAIGFAAVVWAITKRSRAIETELRSLHLLAAEDAQRARGRLGWPQHD